MKETKYNNSVGGGVSYDPCFKIKQIARHFDVSTRTVWRWVASGDMPPPLKIGRICIWAQSDIEAVKERLRSQRKQQRGIFELK
jgi:predicted DNA-binding transcriptional regulator AlpA